MNSQYFSITSFLIITETSTGALTAISHSSTNDRENVNRSLTTGHSSTNDRETVNMSVTTGHSSTNDRENVNMSVTTGHSSTNDRDNVNRPVTTGHSSTNDSENVNRPVTTGNIRLESTVSTSSTSKSILTRDINEQGNFDDTMSNY